MLPGYVISYVIVTKGMTEFEDPNVNNLELKKKKWIYTPGSSSLVIRNLLDAK